MEKMRADKWKDSIFKNLTEQQFEHLALEAFRYQYHHVKIYQQYCQHLGIEPNHVHCLPQIPFLPIEFFKKNEILVNGLTSAEVFTSSGTTGVINSRHFVADTTLYEKSFFSAFEIFYGPITDFCVLALLPSYLERNGSSLVYMASKLIQSSKHPDSGFFLNNYEELLQVLKKQTSIGQKTLLLGVTYALLDIAEQYPTHLKNVVVMETGGMKGRRKELIREELHMQLCNAFGVQTIHSEYGMTELLSQAYSTGDGIFETPPWMKIMIRDTHDPFQFIKRGKSGGINIIDLANIYSCCFIETQDIGRIFADERFTILGRFDQSDIRGCNLMIE